MQWCHSYNTAAASSEARLASSVIFGNYGGAKKGLCDGGGGGCGGGCRCDGDGGGKVVVVVVMVVVVVRSHATRPVQLTRADFRPVLCSLKTDFSMRLKWSFLPSIVSR